MTPESPTATVVYVLFREASDQHGANEIVGVFSSSAAASIAQQIFRNRRTFVKPFLLDPAQFKS